MRSTLSSFALLLQKDFSAFCNDQLQQIDLSQGLMYFILYIGKHPDCSPGRLSGALHLDAGYTTRSLDKLTQAGFIVREKDARDKRAYQLCLTPKGSEAFQTIHALSAQWDDGILHQLDEAERAQLFRLLEKLGTRKEAESCVRKG